jgi:hypothetical protein
MMNQQLLRIGWMVVCGITWIISPWATAADPPSAAARVQATEILQAAGVSGGLIVHLGCGDGKLTAALRANDRYLLHGLAADVTAARQHIQSLGLYGPVSVQQWSEGRLPYVDSLVNLVVADKLGKLPMDEVLRVLVPGGVALSAARGHSSPGRNRLTSGRIICTVRTTTRWRGTPWWTFRVRSSG